MGHWRNQNHLISLWWFQPFDELWELCHLHHRWELQEFRWQVGCCRSNDDPCAGYKFQRMERHPSHHPCRHPTLPQNQTWWTRRMERRHCFLLRSSRKTAEGRENRRNLLAGQHPPYQWLEKAASSPGKSGTNPKRQWRSNRWNRTEKPDFFRFTNVHEG